MALKLTFAPPLIRAAIATLKATLDDQIALFNVEAENLVDLAVPVDANYVFGAAGELGANGFPVVEVAAVQGSSGNWAVGRAEFDHDPRVNVVVWLEGSTGEVPELYEMALGYCRVVIEALAQPQPAAPFGAGVEIAEEQGIFWSVDVVPAAPVAEGRTVERWRTPAFVQFRLEVVERFQ